MIHPDALLQVAWVLIWVVFMWLDLLFLTLICFRFERGRALEILDAIYWTLDVVLPSLAYFCKSVFLWRCFSRQKPFSLRSHSLSKAFRDVHLHSQPLRPLVLLRSSAWHRYGANGMALPTLDL